MRVKGTNATQRRPQSNRKAQCECIKINTTDADENCT